MSIERQAISALKWTGLAKLVGQLASWAITLVVLRILAPSDYGLMAIASVIVSILAGIAELGLGASVVQAARMSQDDLKAVTGLVIVLNLAIGVAVALTAPIASRVYQEPRLTALLQVSSLTFVFNAFSTIPQALAYRDLRFRWLAVTELAAVLATGLVTLAMALSGAGVWALVVGSQAQNLVRTALLLRDGMPWPIIRLRGIRRYLEFGGATTFSRLMVQIAYQADIFIGGRILSQQAIGLYSVSLHVATLPMQKIMGVINQVAFPAVARMQHERERLRSRLLEATRMLMALGVALLWGMSAVAPELVSVVMGEKWRAAVFPLQTVCLAIPLRMLGAVYSTAVLGVGDIAANMRLMLASALVLPIAFYLGAQHGVNGLALAWVVAIPLIVATNLPVMLRTVGIGIRDLVRGIRGAFISGAVMYLSVTFLRITVAGLPTPAALIVLVTAGAVAYLLTLRLTDRDLLGKLRQVLEGLRA